MTKDRVSGFLLLTLSLAYLYQAYNIELYPGSAGDYINAQTFPKAIGIGASLFAFLIMLSPQKDDQGFSLWKTYDWKRPILLVALMLLYGAGIKSVGFLVSTTLFLAGGYVILGERRPLVLLLASLPVAAGFQYVLHALLGIYIVDPLLEAIGIL